METKVLFKRFQYRNLQDIANKNSLHQDEVSGGCLQQMDHLELCVCVCVRARVCARVCVCVFLGFFYLFIFSRGENALAQFLNSHWHMEKQGGGEGGEGQEVSR